MIAFYVCRFQIKKEGKGRHKLRKEIEGTWKTQFWACIVGFLIKPINTYRKSKLQGVVWEFPKGTHTRKRKERVEVVFVLIGKEERKG